MCDQHLLYSKIYNTEQTCHNEQYSGSVQNSRRHSRSNPGKVVTWDLNHCVVLFLGLQPINQHVCISRAVSSFATLGFTGLGFRRFCWEKEIKYNLMRWVKRFGGGGQYIHYDLYGSVNKDLTAQHDLIPSPESTFEKLGMVAHTCNPNA